MSAIAESLLEQFKKLPPSDQQELIQKLLRSLPTTPPRTEKPFPTVNVAGGTITSEQVAEALDDE